MDKYEELKNEFTSLADFTSEAIKDKYWAEEFQLYVVAVSMYLWSKNVLYSPDYAAALQAITGKQYTIDQILTAMSCCGDDERQLAVPNFFKTMVSGCDSVQRWLSDFSSLLAAIAMINGDFTIGEAKALADITDQLTEYARSNGVDTSSVYITSPQTTEINDESYLKNDGLMKDAPKLKTEESDKSAERSQNKSSKNDAFDDETRVPVNINFIINASASGETGTSSMLSFETPVPQAPDVEEKSGETLSSLLEELDGLVGLDNVKQDVHSLINFIRVSQVRKERGMKVPTISYHLVFTGNPGTGKTTVARLVARLYYQMGILPKGQLVETDRSALVAGYLGQTAIKTQKVIQSAMGGVLFIDEAYSLAGENDDSYGKEAIETILKAMEDHRDELVVIVAGYTELMHKFIESNPGLSSRFSKYFEFNDYSADELIAIFNRFCDNNGYTIDEGALELLQNHFQTLYDQRDEHFGNARTARNIFEKSINAQANRIADLASFSDHDLETITVDDIKSVVGGAV